MSRTIYIPTYGRERVMTVYSLPLYYKTRVMLVVKDSDVGRRLASSCGLNPDQYIVCSEQGKGIHRVREWILNRCSSMSQAVCCMLDDDISLTTAVFEEGKKRFRRQDDSVLTDHIDDCFIKAAERGVGLVSFSWPFFNASVKRWEENKDSAASYFVNLESRRLSGASFDLPSCDDRRFGLETLAAGYSLWANTHVGVKKVGKHGKGGEAAVGGRGERHKASILKLAEEFPRFVRLRLTTSPAYLANYGTNQTAMFLYSNMAKAVARGEDPRSQRK